MFTAVHKKSGSHGVPNVYVSLIDYGKVLCSSANKLQLNSNVSAKEE